MKPKFHNVSPVAPFKEKRFNQLITTPQIFMKSRCLAFLFLPVLVFGQAAPAPAPAGNLIKNGRFEEFVAEDNLWDGVDNDGFLAGDSGATEGQGGSFGFSRSVDAILEGGNMGRIQMPISVQVADLNGDGLLDIMTVDCAGYFRVYFNSGTRTEPKFTQSETVPLFLGRFAWNMGLKICLADINHNNAPDLFIGNYLGQIIRIKNMGGSTSPNWPQLQSNHDVIWRDKDLVKDTRGALILKENIIDTTRDGQLWANLLAPAVYDWNNDGRVDILVGEGSYSANAIHLLLNQGSSSAPKFDEDHSEYLAYGDGREQLVPAVVDYNGDGFPDLLVGDRMGNINVYLSEGRWKKGVELKRQKDPISFGGLTSIGTTPVGTRCVAPTVADLNGDGLFDIIVGKPNGRIAVSYNIGTKTEPKFGPLVELKGEDLWKKGTVRRLSSIANGYPKPAEWTANFGYRQGNILGYVTTVSPAEDPNVGNTTSPYVLKFGYNPTFNKVFHKPEMILQSLVGISLKNEFQVPGNMRFDTFKQTGWNWYTADYAQMGVDSNYAILIQNIDTGVLKPSTNYKLSFKVKGNGVKKATATLCLGGWLIRDMSKPYTPANTTDNMVCEAVVQNVDFPVGSNWNAVTRTINFKFQKYKDLDNPEKWSGAGSKVEYRAVLDIRAALNPGDGVFYIDDVQLTPQ